jgi:hypothetical protein
MRALTFRERLRQASAEGMIVEAAKTDPWHEVVARLQGRAIDGYECITSAECIEALALPERDHDTGAFRRLAKLMPEYGWERTKMETTEGGECRGWRRPVNTPLPAMRSETDRMPHGGIFLGDVSRKKVSRIGGF